MLLSAELKRTSSSVEIDLIGSIFTLFFAHTWPMLASDLVRNNPFEVGKMITRSFLFVALAAAALTLGCQGDNEGVTGTITLDGQPLTDAEVVFTPQEGGRPAMATTDASGKYELIYTVNQRGAPPGKYIVRIRSARTETGENGQDVNIPEKVPAKYNQKSELAAEIQDGQSNQFNFDLESQ